MPSIAFFLAASPICLDTTRRKSWEAELVPPSRNYGEAAKWIISLKSAFSLLKLPRMGPKVELREIGAREIGSSRRTLLPECSEIGLRQIGSEIQIPIADSSLVDFPST